MKKYKIYISTISDIKWLIYDIPGNMGWIMYILCLILCFVKQPDFTDIPLVSLSLFAGFLPAIAMLIGIVELIRERILKMDRILPQKRLYRGFGALTWGGAAGMLVGLNALFTSIRAGASLSECKLLIMLAAGGVLCALFVGLIFKTFHPQDAKEDAVC